MEKHLRDKEALICQANFLHKSYRVYTTMLQEFKCKN